ncbi:alpha-2,8-sialyltransferase 8F-like [Saccoglossus kowalevskii]|uniref:Alpha-2,8-sialyltransferase 8F-like n=1 Tax=Saccoglossus kowalevskii TaxID=10224 RepID=A0ABM0MCN0_SACKO|nr:PREDICTED: alpha-2,8-sialyltransferase 8F-like [Saccoglossus kowalevskii]
MARYLRGKFSIETLMYTSFSVLTLFCISAALYSYVYVNIVSHYIQSSNVHYVDCNDKDKKNVEGMQRLEEILDESEIREEKSEEEIDNCQWAVRRIMGQTPYFTEDINNAARHALAECIFKDDNKNTQTDERQLSQIMKKKAANLKSCHRNATTHTDFKRELHRYMNQTSSVLTQKNTKIGSMYTNLYGKSGLRLNQKMWDSLSKIQPFSKVSQFKTCAIVGNSHILKVSKCGHEIDNYEYIIRSNMPEIGKSSVDSGIRTNLTSLGPTSRTLYLENTKGEFDKAKFLKVAKEYTGHLIWIHNSMNIFNSAVFKVTDALKNHHSLKLLLANHEYFRKFQYFLQETGQTFSTDMALIGMSISLCEEIHLYGIWPYLIDLEANILQPDYAAYNKLSKKENNLIAEFNLLQKLHCIGVLKIHIEKCL